MADRLVLFIFLAGLTSCYGVDSLRFLVIGDWGGMPYFPYFTPIEYEVAKQMANVTERYKSSFNLALGDNFYTTGVTDVDDKRFKETFENIYKYESLQNPWYLIAGNHDHYGNVSAQIAYSKKSLRWKFPNYYYALEFMIPGGKLVDIVMIDTVLLCGNTKPDIEGGQPEPPILADKIAQSEEQWTWIENQLKNSKGDYLLVAGHFPVYSIAEHGPTKCLLDRLKPLLNKYKVSAYFSGHDHNLQHISGEEENGHRVEYIVTGAANLVQYSKAHAGDVPPGSVKYYWAELFGLGGFSYVEATPENMTMIFVDGLNKQLYECSILPRK